MNNESNRRLAGLLGWTSIVDVGGALLGTPPAGSAQCRGQAKVPDWAGDWRECGPLSAQYKIDIEQNQRSVIASHNCHRTLCKHPLSEGDSRDAATRRAVIAAVCAKLEAGQ